VEQLPAKFLLVLQSMLHQLAHLDEEAFLRAQLAVLPLATFRVTAVRLSSGLIGACPRRPSQVQEDALQPKAQLLEPLEKAFHQAQVQEPLERACHQVPTGQAHLVGPGRPQARVLMMQLAMEARE